MSQFHPLVVTDVHHTIRDAVVLTLKPEDPETGSPDEEQDGGGSVSRETFALSLEELCEKPLGASDYLAIAGRFRTFFVDRIPKLGWAQNNEAHRLVTLIDAFYEAKVRLYCSAEVPPEQIYTEGKGAFEFARTVSRLAEMQSARWMARN